MFFCVVQCEKTLKLFGEEPQSVQPDEFFGVFELFLVSFADARLDNERLQRLKADDEKRQKMEAQVRDAVAKRPCTRQTEQPKRQKTKPNKSSAVAHTAAECCRTRIVKRWGGQFSREIKREALIVYAGTSDQIDFWSGHRRSQDFLWGALFSFKN